MKFNKKLILSLVLFTASFALSQQPVFKQSATDLTASICDYIIAGDLGKAQQFAEQNTDVNSPSVKKASDIVASYQAIDLRRQQQKKEILSETVLEFNKLKSEIDANGLSDINDVSAVLGIAIKIDVYSEESNKGQILENQLVARAIKAALERSLQYEKQGKFLDSLVYCYTFLTALDQDNKQWKDHKEMLTEKAIIKASLTDNPCETSQQRHDDIKKNMFVRAIMALDYNYVSPIDYTDMAVKALKRCQLLIEVLDKMDSDETLAFNKGPAEIKAWHDGIDEITENIQKNVMGITRDKFIGIFESVLRLNTNTIDMSKEVLISQFAEASLAELDPHTNIVWPWYVEGFKKNMSSEFSGIGVEISKADGFLKINSLLPETPAYNAGLDAGEIIEAVNGELTKDMSIECVVRKITGPSGTKVTLTMKNPLEDKSRDVVIIRDRIKVKTVKSWQREGSGEWQNMVDANNRIGYVRVTSFTSEQTSNELEKQLVSLESKGMKGLILDLRFNSGGYLNQAVAMVDKFVKEGIIVTTKPRLGSFPSWEVAHEKGTHPDYPLVVLINGQSASASEIVAGALQDEIYKRAIIVGSQSYGKGSVQTIIDYPGGGSQLKYTMAYYHLPSGQRVKNRYAREKLDKEDWGIIPDIKIELRGDEIKKMYDVQRDNAVLAGKDHQGETVKHPLQELIESDPQLSVAIEVTKAMILKKEMNRFSVKK